MRLKLYIATLAFLCLIFFNGCSQKQLLTEGQISIGAIGDIERFEYSNVVYESLDVEDLLTNDELKTQFDFLMISNEHFNTVSETTYVERFDELCMSVVFVDSMKGWMPFISPLYLEMPKLYKDFNDQPQKQSIVSKYELSGAFIGKAFNYSKDETLSQENFEEIATAIFQDKVGNDESPGW